MSASQGPQDPLLAKYSFKEREQPLGSGAFGTVVIGTQRVDSRNYALKFVDSREAEWQREYQLLSEMRHDNVLRVVEMFEAHGPERSMTGLADHRQCFLRPRLHFCIRLANDAC